MVSSLVTYSTTFKNKFGKKTMMNIGKSYLNLIPSIVIENELVPIPIQRKEIIKALLELGVDEDLSSIPNDMLKKMYGSHPKYGDNYKVRDDYETIDYYSFLTLDGKRYFA